MPKFYRFNALSSAKRVEKQPLSQYFVCCKLIWS